MSDEFEITIPVVRGEGVGVPIGEIQRAINSICQQTQTDLNLIASGGFPLTDVDITGGTITGVAISNSTGVTQPTTDNSTLLATDAFVNQQIIRSTETVPITLTGGVYNQATLGTGFSPVVFASGGVVQSILTIVNPGSGYAVGDLITLAGGNDDATLRVATLSGSGVASVTVLYGGTGYTTGVQLMGTPIPPGDRNVVFTGTLTSNVTFIIAAGTYNTASRRPSFVNNTTGNFTVTVFLSNGADGTTGTGYVLPQGTANSTSVLLQTDGETGVWPVTTLAGVTGTINVVNLGADPTGVNDSTAAIQSALNTSKSVFLPAGTYKISAVLTCGSAGISFIGASRGSTIITQSTLNTGIFSDQGFASTRFANLTLTYSGTATSGAMALSLTGFYSSADNFTINNAYVGASSNSANSVSYNNFQINGCISTSLQLLSSFNVNVSNFFLTASNQTQVSSGHLVVQTGQGHNFVTGEIFEGVSSAVMSSYQYCKFSQVYFDSSAQGATIATATGISFIDCWFSGGRSGGGFPGVTVGNIGGTDTSAGVNFTGCEFINCGGDGALVYAGPVNTNFANCLVGANSATAGANVKHGLEFAANCSHFTVTDCQINNSLGTLGTQAYGVLVDSGSSNNYSILNNDIQNNATGSVSDLGTGTNKLVFNPSTQSTLTLPFNTASTSTGTGSLVVVGGAGVSGALNMGGSINVSYSGAAINLSDTSGTQKAQVVFKNNGTTVWDIGNSSTNGSFALDRWVSGSYVDSPITVSDSTGLVTFSDGVNPSQTAGIVGTTTNNNANAGSVGEYVTATGTAVSLTNNTPANCTSISLTAGDWDVYGSALFNPAGTTTTNAILVGISTTSATAPAAPLYSILGLAAPAGVGNSLVAPSQRISLASTTTVYLVTNAIFAVSTMTVTGQIWARRRR